MFYTKYRPQKFEELVGLDSVKKALLNSLSKRRIGHAYLFSGPRGTGKTSTARILAKAVNCAQVEGSNWKGEPCGECSSCQAIEEGRFLDLIEIDAASNRGIDDIRRLREKIRLSPSQGRKKVYVVDEAHMLTREAFNALLKTLEEPPSHAVFILCTTEPERVPGTIHSRCQIFEFRRASRSAIVEKLQRICDMEDTELSSEDLERIAKAARGGFRDAETLLEQVIVGGEVVDDLVGGVRGSNLPDFVDFLLGGNGEEAFLFLNRFYEGGGNLESFNNSLLEYLRDLLLIKVGVGRELVEVSDESYQKMSEQTSLLGGGKLTELINGFTQAGRKFSFSPIPTLPMELVVLDVCSVSDSVLEDGNVAVEGRCSQYDKSCDGGAHCGGDLKVIEGRWNDILRKIRPYNHSLEALLRSMKLQAFDGDSLTLKAFYPFHKDRLSSSRNRKLVEKAVSEVLLIPVRVRCVLGSKEHVRSGKSGGRPKRKGKEDSEQEAVDVFGGEL